MNTHQRDFALQLPWALLLLLLLWFARISRNQKQHKNNTKGSTGPTRKSSSPRICFCWCQGFKETFFLVGFVLASYAVAHSKHNLVKNQEVYWRSLCETLGCKLRARRPSESPRKSQPKLTVATFSKVKLQNPIHANRVCPVNRRKRGPAHFDTKQATLRAKN